MPTVSFKERVKNVIISEVKKYKSVYVDNVYLVCSSAFTQSKYYIIDAKEDNFQHLTGVHSLVSPQMFYEKALNGTLQEADFDFNKKRQSEKSVIGSVRRKIKVLPNMMHIFNGHFNVQEKFVKNRVVCSFATTDNICTIGFRDVGYAIPISLIRGNETDTSKVRQVDIVLKKKQGIDKFDQVVIGDISELLKYYDVIKEKVSDDMNKKILEYKETLKE